MILSKAHFFERVKQWEKPTAIFINLRFMYKGSQRIYKRMKIRKENNQT
jgi:hypothetical protein